MYLAVASRVVLAFVLLFILARLAGKKQIAQLTFFDFITAIAVGDLAAGHMANPEQPLGPFALGLVLWFGLHLSADVIAVKWRRGGKLLEGEPTVVIQKGRILEDKLGGLMLRADDLMGMLRAKGYFDVRHVEYGVMETDGNLSVLPTPAHRPATPKDLGLRPVGTGMSAEVVVEGRVFTANLARFGRDEAWLRQQLAVHGVQDLNGVFYCTLNERGELYIDLYRDHIKVAVDISDYPGPN